MTSPRRNPEVYQHNCTISDIYSVQFVLCRYKITGKVSKIMPDQKKRGRPRGSIGKKNTSTDSAKKRKVNASKRCYREGKIRIEFWVSPETKEQWERMKEVENVKSNNGDALAFLLGM